jgi:hypothetical protein
MVKKDERSDLKLMKPATPESHNSSSKETFNACGKLVRAAYLFLTFVFVILIPYSRLAEKCYPQKPPR